MSCFGMSSESSWPPAWVGSWTAADGKTVEIRRSGHRVLVTVSPHPEAPPYTSAELLRGGTKLIRDLEATCAVDAKGRKYLEVEAGTEGIGPSYRLYAGRAVPDREGVRPAGDDLDPEQVVLAPQCLVGLYDDYEDDLGVPWAYPLQPLERPAR